MMKKALSVLIILSFLSGLQFGQTGAESSANKPVKPKIGLLKFSVNTFDEEKKLIEKNSKGITNIIKESLEKDFIIHKEFKEAITYSDIEDPMVTIDPVVEPETEKTLEALSKDNGLDGVVFGHFYQEDKLIVVFRYYIPKYKYPKVKERIISSSPGFLMGKENEKPVAKLKNAVRISIQQLTTEVKKVQAKISEPPKKIEPVKVKKDKKEVKPQKKPDKPKTVKKEDKPKKTGKVEVKQKIKVPKKSIRVNHELEKLTAKEVYRMIIDNGFYSEVVSGSGFHGEGLQGIQLPKDGFFPSKRIVTAVIEDKTDLIRTQSVYQGTGNGEREILLWWDPEIKSCSFEGASLAIRNLNSKYEDKNRKWRIPTMKELYSIVDQDNQNHFHKIFDRLFPKKKSLIFWTSTAVEKEGTVLDYEKNKKSHFVLRSIYNKKNDVYSLSFGLQNIEGVRKAYLLPVSSEIVYTYRPSPDPTAKEIPGFDDKKDGKGSKGSEGEEKKIKPPGDKKVPGFDDPATMPDAEEKKDDSPKASPQPRSPKSKIPPKSDKIPGFDDVPDTKKRYPSRIEKNQSKVKITLFPFVRRGMLGTNKERLLNNVNDEIEETLKMVDSELNTKVNCRLIIDKKSTNVPDDVSEMDKLYKRLSDRRKRLRDGTGWVISNIMAPQNIDIVITVQHIAEPDLIFIRPIIISCLNDKTYYKKFIQDKIHGYGDLKKFISITIKEIIYDTFGERDDIDEVQ